MFLFPVSFLFLAVFHIKQDVLAFNVGVNNYITHKAEQFLLFNIDFILNLCWASIFFLVSNETK